MSMPDWPGETGLAFAGALGGLVRWITLRSHWTDGIGSVAVGAICAVFFGERFAPVMFAAAGAGLRTIEPFIGPVVLQQSDFIAPSAFLFGIGGIAIAGLVIDLWRGFRARAGERKGDGH